MNQSIPEFLYRGDNDKKNSRDLKATLHYYQLQTQLLKGGHGHEVFNTPLVELIKNHVYPGWGKTHFLSFSEDKFTAMRYGLDCELEHVNDLIYQYEEYYEAGTNWDFTIIEIDTDRLLLEEKAPGIFLGSYKPSLTKFKMVQSYNIILIDVVNALSKSVENSIQNKILEIAKRDKEWLILPATTVSLNYGKSEFSGILDIGEIANILKYKKI